MSIHGICFDEGQAGHCGFNCDGHYEGECTIQDEIVWNHIEHLIKTDIDYIANMFLGPLRYEVMKAQTVMDISIKDQIEKAARKYTDPELIEFFAELGHE